MAATTQDQYNRLQHFMCCLGRKGDSLSSKLKLGTQCTCDINTLELLVMYWETLVCYDPTATNNCLTQIQVDAIWDHISKLCGICFAPYGSTYISPRLGCGSRITASGNRRVTASGDTRVIACGTSTPATPNQRLLPESYLEYYVN